MIVLIPANIEYYFSVHQWLYRCTTQFNIASGHPPVISLVFGAILFCFFLLKSKLP
jgi:hypothetical protein